MNKEPGHKQHLNLSCTAYEVIQNDLHAFGQGSLSGFLNTVFLNYYEEADATIDHALFRRRMELMEILKPISDTALREQTCQLMLEQELERLWKKVQSYPKAYGFKFYLNTECTAVLTESAPLIDQYYKSRQMLYVKAVIEEYASHSPLERERLFFRNTFEHLQACIEGGYLVTIETGGKRFDAKPWQIVPDEGGLYYYLIALSCPAGEAPADAVPASFRISRITAVKKRPKSYRSGKLTAMEADTLRAALAERGAAFLVGQPEEIVVRLTETGTHLFDNKRFLRPTPIHTEERPDGTYYTFRCTPYQIQSYFLVFAADAEVISPMHLRERFKTLLHDAARLYD